MPFNVFFLCWEPKVSSQREKMVIFPSLKIQTIIFAGNILLFFRDKRCFCDDGSWKGEVPNYGGWAGCFWCRVEGASRLVSFFCLCICVFVFVWLPLMSSKGSKQTCESLKSKSAHNIQLCILYSHYIGFAFDNHCHRQISFVPPGRSQARATLQRWCSQPCTGVES